MSIYNFFQSLRVTNFSETLRQKKKMLSHIRQKGEPLTILEAGASDGTDTIEFSQILQSRDFYHPDNKIYAFEPIPRSYELLEKKICSCTNAVAIPKALGSDNVSQSIYVSKNSNIAGGLASSSSLLPPKKTLSFHPHIKFDAQDIVDTITLDSWAVEYGVEKIDFMWLDMQGMEMRALQSGLAVLRTTKAIFSEVSFLEMYEGAPLYEEYKAWLGSLGFSLVFVDKACEDMGNAFFLRSY